MIRGLFWLPAAPVLVLLFILLLRRLGALPTDPTTAVLFQWCVFMVASLGVAAWSLARFGNQVTVRQTYGNTEEQKRMMDLVDGTLVRLTEAQQALEKMYIERSPPSTADSESGQENRPGRRLLGSMLVFAVMFIATVSIVSATFEGIGESSTKARHDHITFAVFINGERIDYSHPAFDLQTRNFPAGHLHTPDQDLLHLEGQEGITLAEIFENGLGSHLTNQSITLDDLQHGGQTFTTNATHGLYGYVSPVFSHHWVPLSDVAEYAPHDGDRILVTYGDISPEMATQQMAQVT